MRTILTICVALLCLSDTEAGTPKIKQTNVSEGTLTFTSNAVVFASFTETNIFKFVHPTLSGTNGNSVADIPGLLLVKFEKKAEIRHHERFDRSELTVKNSEVTSPCASFYLE
jgi:hypothetical protein